MTLRVSSAAAKRTSAYQGAGDCSNKTTMAIRMGMAASDE
jgi:hypothetical protein